MSRSLVCFFFNQFRGIYQRSLYIRWFLIYGSDEKLIDDFARDGIFSLDEMWLIFNKSLGGSAGLFANRA